MTTLVLKAIPKLPGAVLGTSPIVVTAAGVNYTASLDLVALKATLDAYYQPAFTLAAGVATWLATPSSGNLRAAVTDETGTGALVFGTAPIFTTNITVPLIIGGSAAGSTLTLQSTSGVGTTDTIDFNTGAAGARRWRINTNGTMVGTPLAGTVGPGITLSMAPSGTNSNNSWNLLNITSDNVNNGDATFSVGLNVSHSFGGSAMTGGREAIQGLATLSSASNASNTNRNYIGIQGVGTATSGDGGTNTGAGALGAVFGGGSWGDAQSGATNLLHVCGLEVDVSIRTGASAKYKNGITITSHALDAVDAASQNAGLAISSQAGSVKLTHGIIFSDFTGAAPVKTTGTLIGTSGTATVDKGVDLSGYTIATSAYASPGFAVDGSGTPTFLSVLAVPAGGTAGKGVKFSSTSNLGVFFGSGVPTLSAAQGSLYVRTDGSSTSTRLYVNTNGTTGWTNVTTAT